MKIDSGANVHVKNDIVPTSDFDDEGLDRENEANEKIVAEMHNSLNRNTGKAAVQMRFDGKQEQANNGTRSKNSGGDRTEDAENLVSIASSDRLYKKGAGAQQKDYVQDVRITKKDIGQKKVQYSKDATQGI